MCRALFYAESELTASRRRGQAYNARKMYAKA
jgi:hypothetical protein